MSKRRDQAIRQNAKAAFRHANKRDARYQRPRGRKPSIDEAIERIQERFERRRFKRQY